jgi:beta-ribofuranosylaminobenzene 5'-phosphate synthase
MGKSKCFVVKSSIRIQTFCRIHLTLIDLSNDGFRRNGGLGFATEHPCANIIAAPQQVNEVVSTYSAINDKLKQHLDAARRELGLKNGVRVNISFNVRPHTGFGTGTSIKLGCLEALLLLNGILPTEEELIRLSRRGGTSGIGVRTYFHGGVVLDAGKKNDKSLFLPSSASLPNHPPLPLLHYLEAKLSLGLCLPEGESGLSAQAEVDFFSKVCPLPISEVSKTAYLAAFGFMPALIEGDMLALGQAINEIQSTSWKNSERMRFRIPIQKIEATLVAAGSIGTGMSSMGPAVFFVGDVPRIIEKCSSSLPNCSFTETAIRNKGRILE